MYLGVWPGMILWLWRRVLTTSRGLLTSGPIPPLSPPNSIASHGSSSFFPVEVQFEIEGQGRDNQVSAKRLRQMGRWHDVESQLPSYPQATLATLTPLSLPRL